jgi:hypothetical protein
VQENLLVRPIATGRYQLVFGERRLRCAIAAGRTEVPAIVRALDDHQARVLTLTENLRRQRLHFLDEADAVAGLVEESWTLAEVAAELRKPLSWAARRHRLLHLTPAWRQLADRPAGWVVTWSAADFEEIAILAPDAQDDLLTRSRHRLERCATARELAQLVRSLTRPVAGFPWSPTTPISTRSPARAAPAPIAAAGTRASSTIGRAARSPAGRARRGARSPVERPIASSTRSAPRRRPGSSSSAAPPGSRRSTRGSERRSDPERRRPAVHPADGRGRGAGRRRAAGPPGARHDQPLGVAQRARSLVTPWQGRPVRRLEEGRKGTHHLMCCRIVWVICLSGDSLCLPR